MYYLLQWYEFNPRKFVNDCWTFPEWMLIHYSSIYTITFHFVNAILIALLYNSSILIFLSKIKITPQYNTEHFTWRQSQNMKTISHAHVSQTPWIRITKTWNMPQSHSSETSVHCSLCLCVCNLYLWLSDSDVWPLWRITKYYKENIIKQSSNKLMLLYYYKIALKALFCNLWIKPEISVVTIIPV